MSLKCILFGTLAVAVVLLLLVMWIGKITADNDYLRLQADGLKRENLSLGLELSANRAAALAREAEKERLARENAALVAAINEVYANDPSAKNWADDLCPDGILCLLD